MSAKYDLLNGVFLVVVVILVAVMVSSCGEAVSPTTPANMPPVPNMANPASVFCEQNGGKSVTQTAADGSQSAACVFADGSVCDEWAFFRGECGQDKVTPAAQPGGVGLANPASVFCQEQGGTGEIRTAADGSQSGVCILADGSECDEWAFYRGECGADKVTPAAQP